MIEKMKDFQDLYTASDRKTPVLFFDMNTKETTDFEKDDIIALIKNDYKEEIGEMIEKGINLNSIVIVSADSKARTVFVDVINKPYKKK